MAIKPTKYPTWAQNDELDPITLAANKVEPTEEWKGSGQKRRQPIPRPYMNYQFDLLSRWIEWIDEQVTGAPSATLEAAWPIGSVYYSTSLANPAIAFGFGTWTAIGQGRFVVGYNAGDSDFNAVKKTGGAKTHTHGGVTGSTTLTIDQIPSHVHQQQGSQDAGSDFGYVMDNNNQATDLSVPVNTLSAGGGQGHNHTISSASSLPPFLVLVLWERVA